MHNRLIYSLIAAFSIVIVFSACLQTDELGEMEVIRPEGEYVLPLVKAEVNMNDLVQELDEYTEFDTTDDGLILFRYSGDLLRRTSFDIFNSIESSLNNIPIIIDQPEFPIPFTTPDGMEIYLMDVSTGYIVYFFQFEVTETVDVIIEIPELSDAAGVPFKLEDTYGPGNISVLDTIFLAGMQLNADDNGEVKVLHQIVYDSGVTDVFNSFIITINDLSFDYAEGNFYNQMHPGALDTIEIELFESWKGGEVIFEDPTITLTVDNSFGVPTRSVVEVFDVYSVDGTVESLDGDAVTDGINFEYPLLNEVGVTKTTSFVFDKDNSNVQSLLSSKPLYVEYLVDAITNPDGDPIVGFIDRESEYSVNVEVELPIHCKVIDFLVIDTFELDLQMLDNGTVKEAGLLLNYETALPIAIDMQLRMLDESGQDIGPVFDEPGIKFNAVSIDSDGEAIGSDAESFFIEIDADKIEDLARTKQLVLDVKFNTPNNDQVAVKVRPEQFLKFNLGLNIKR